MTILNRGLKLVTNLIVWSFTQPVDLNRTKLQILWGRQEERKEKKQPKKTTLFPKLRTNKKLSFKILKKYPY